jgi:hypothetical protein
MGTHVTFAAETARGFIRNSPPSHLFTRTGSAWDGAVQAPAGRCVGFGDLGNPVHALERRDLMAPLTKDYSVFDCDAHVTETTDLWNYLSEKELEVVRPYWWHDGPYLIVNGDRLTFGNWGIGRANYLSGDVNGTTTLVAFAEVPKRTPNAVEAAGPGVNKKIIRKLRSMNLSDEQLDYVDHAGARDPHARVKDMDLQGIDQVVGIPNQMLSAYLWVESFDAAALIARAYNDQIYDWCAPYPERLFPAAVLPVHSPLTAVGELERVAARGFKLAMLRPVDIQGRYPNLPTYRPLWEAFESTGLVVAIHNLVFSNDHLRSWYKGQWTPGAFVNRAVNGRQITSPS